jgi:hypothetical protein
LRVRLESDYGLFWFRRLVEPVLVPLQNSITLCLKMKNLMLALESGAKPDLLPEEVRRRFTEALILEEFDCYASSQSGRGFHVEWTAAGGVTMVSRIAYFGTARTTLEFTLTAPAHLIQGGLPVLGNLLTSFQEQGNTVAQPP